MGRLIIECAIRAALIAAATAIVLRALQIRTASARHAAWAGVVVAMILLPAWMAWGPKAALPVLPPAQVRAAAVDSVSYDVQRVPVQVALPRPAVSVRRLNWAGWLVGVYLTGLGLLLVRLAIGTVRARRLNSACCAAPVTVGLLRPRVILPECWREWPPAQLDAILTHEREHARRRDPLFQWLALLNRALFWFHPLAWWLERRLSVLAEESCDAAVLASGCDPVDYSEYLLELARSVERAGGRVNAVAMAMPGSALPWRIRNIMGGIREARISRIRLACAALACAIPAALFAAGTLDRIPELLPLPAFPARPMPQAPELQLVTQVNPGQAKPVEAKLTESSTKTETKLQFEVASVRRRDPALGGGRGGPGCGPQTSDAGRISFSCAQLAEIIRVAYGVDFDQISGPAWLYDEHYDIAAKIPEGATQEQSNVMLQNLLADRFQMTLHRVPKEFPTYVLTIAKGGSKLKESVGAEAKPAGAGGFANPGVIQRSFHDMPLAGLIFELGAGFGTITGSNRFAMARVEDKTGLTGKYDFALEYAGGVGPGGFSQSPPVEVAALAPDIFEALEKQLGLKLTKSVATEDVIVIDHIEKIPTEN